MTTTTTIILTATPSDVSVSDERGTVRGIVLTTPAGSYEIIPPEGDSRDCWLGDADQWLRDIDDDGTVIDWIRDALCADGPSTSMMVCAEDGGWFESAALDSRDCQCDRCGVAGWWVDTTAGEVVIDGRGHSVPIDDAHHAYLMSTTYGDLTCPACTDEDGEMRRGERYPHGRDSRQAISEATAFDAGNEFATEAEVREYLSASAQRDLFGDAAVVDRDLLSRWADLIIENGWHCAFGGGETDA